MPGNCAFEERYSSCGSLKKIKMSSELTNIIYGVELQVTVIIPSLAFDL